MKYRLRVNVTSKVTKLGINVYDTFLKAQTRQLELDMIGIKSVVVDEFGGKIK